VTPITCTFPTPLTARHGLRRAAAAALLDARAQWGRDGTPLMNSHVGRDRDLPTFPSLSSNVSELMFLPSCAQFWAGDKVVICEYNLCSAPRI
jgi:hypothetical protein